MKNFMKNFNNKNVLNVFGFAMNLLLLLLNLEFFALNFLHLFIQSEPILVHILNEMVLFIMQVL